MTTTAGPIDAVVAVTYRCNLHCRTCDLGGRADAGTLTPEVLAKLPASLRYVNITGGEPFLGNDLTACIRAVVRAAPRAAITISTNGMLVERAAAVVAELLPDVPGLRVAVSVDGAEATHDYIRRAPGSYRKALATIDRLQPLLGPNVHVAFTISAENAGDVGAAAALADGRGLPLSLALTHTSEHFFRPEADAVPDKEAAHRAADEATRYYSKRLSPRAAARAYFAWGLHRVIDKRPRLIPCRAGDRFFFIDPAAEVYLCNMRGEPIGNLRRRDFGEIWRGEKRRALLATTGRACPLQCWMVCTARTSLRDHPLRVAAWAARAYLRGGARRRP